MKHVFNFSFCLKTKKMLPLAEALESSGSIYIPFILWQVQSYAAFNFIPKAHIPQGSQ